MNNHAPNIEHKPKTPRATPIPIPAFAPVDRPSGDGGDVSDWEDVEDEVLLVIAARAKL